AIAVQMQLAVPRPVARQGSVRRMGARIVETTITGPAWLPWRFEPHRRSRLGDFDEAEASRREFEKSRPCSAHTQELGVVANARFARVANPDHNPFPRRSGWQPNGSAEEWPRVHVLPAIVHDVGFLEPIEMFRALHEHLGRGADGPRSIRI